MASKYPSLYEAMKKNKKKKPMSAKYTNSKGIVYSRQSTKEFFYPGPMRRTLKLKTKEYYKRFAYKPKSDRAFNKQLKLKVAPIYLLYLLP
jgi:hypothetical protein